ncbi:MAG: YfiR family protein [Bacteroidota bacterium]
MKIVIGIACLVVFASSSVEAQQYKYHTIFIYNFSRYIEWPTDDTGEDFTVSVLGKAGAYREMVDLAQKKKSIKNRSFVVRQCSSVGEANDSDIVFITAGSRVKPEEIQALQDSGALVVTELDDIQGKGSHINFITTRDSKLGFEINEKTADNSGFKIAGALSGLATKTYK